MNRLAHPLWNGDEGRIRAFWRLSLQAVLLLSSLVLFALLAPWIAAIPGGELVLTIHMPLMMIVTVWVAGSVIDRRRLIDFGLRLDRDWWLDSACGLVLGGLLMVGVFAVASVSGWIEPRVASGLSFRESTPLLLRALVEFGLVAIGEELFSRGYQLRNLAEGLRGRLIGPRASIIAGVVLSSAVFAALHFLDGELATLRVVNTFLGGVLLALSVAYTGRLGLAIGFHLTWNFAQGPILGFPVSGNAPQAALLAINEYGPELWTGGAYGPEGGLLATSALVVAIVLALGWIRARHGPLRLDSDVARYSGRAQGRQS